MNISLYTQTIKVFVADVSEDMQAKKNKLCAVLKKARIEIVCANENANTQEIKQLISGTDSSIHILGAQDIYNKDSKYYNTKAAVEYRIAKEIVSNNFRMFLWNPYEINSSKYSYINKIRRDIVENIIYSSIKSPIVFVEELRNIISKQDLVNQNIDNKDVFFIYSDLDRETANDILNMLEDVLSVTKLSITMGNHIDYTQYINNQLNGCKIGVIYYDYANDWAISFARQIWKDSGGQSSKTPLLLIGNAEHAKKEEQKIFEKIIENTIREIRLIPLEIKVFFDKTTAQDTNSKVNEISNN